MIARRERENGIESLGELDDLPGFPRAFLTELKRHVRV